MPMKCIDRIETANVNAAAARLIGRSLGERDVQCQIQGNTRPLYGAKD